MVSFTSNSELTIFLSFYILHLTSPLFTLGLTPPLGGIKKILPAEREDLVSVLRILLI